MTRTFRLSAAALAAVLGPSAAAAFAPDAQGDFLPSDTGPHAGDLGVLFADGLWNPASQMFSFGGVMSAPIGTTAGALDVWGIGGGTGTERFVTGTPSIGRGVVCDSVISLNPSAQAHSVNLLNGTTFTLAASAVTISGNTIVVDVPVADLPGMGRSNGQCGWNLWPRGPGISGNAAISDFAPDASTPPVVTVVPEPAHGSLLLGGSAALGITRRRPQRQV